MPRILNSRKFRSLLPYLLFAIAVLIAYKVVNELDFLVGIVGQMWSILTPFFYGFILAYIVNMPCEGVKGLLEKSNSGFIAKRKRALSVIIVFFIFAVILSLVINLIVPAVSRSVSLFIANFPAYYENARHMVDYINGMELFGLYINVDAVVKLFQDMLHNSGLQYFSSSVNALISVSSAIFKGFLAIVSSIYFLVEKEKLQAFLCRLLKAFTSSRAYEVTIGCADKINNNFKQYIKTQTIDGCILGGIVTIELFIMGSPFALILGIMLGIVNYIPYFGSIFGSLVAVVIVAFTQGLTVAAIAAVVILITQQIDGNIIQPRLMGGSFALSPLLIIVSITVGGAAAGLLGMIVAIPIVAFLRDILESVILYYEGKKARQSG